MFPVSEYLQPGKGLVVEKEENANEEEKEASDYWKSILKRKGLPITTPYQYIPNWPKDTDEAYCDTLFVKAKMKREAEGLAAFSAALHASQNAPKINNDPPSFVYQTGFAFNFRDKKRRTKSVNGIVYKDPELEKKRKLLVQETINAMPKYLEARAAEQEEIASKSIYYYY